MKGTHCDELARDFAKAVGGPLESTYAWPNALGGQPEADGWWTVEEADGGGIEYVSNESKR